jgi:23S rRNA pseudouridine1911/1915/1917 synthase
MDTQFFIADESDCGLRLDVFCSNNCDLTRSRIKNLIDGGLVLVNEKQTKSGYSVKNNDQIKITIPDLVECNAVPQDIPIDIIYEDDDIAVINKPQGMVTHPSTGSPDKTLVNALLFHLNSLSDINGVIRPGIVHRLDKDTSGLLVVAKNNEAHISLAKQIAEKTAHRICMKSFHI